MPKRRFKVGDVVEATRDVGSIIRKGEKYHINKITTNFLEDIDLIMFRGIISWWNSKDFKLVDDKYKGLIGTKGMF